MPWFHDDTAFAYGGEGDDKDLVTVSNRVGVVSVSRQTSRVQTGAGGLDFDLTTNGNRAVLFTTGITTATTRVYVFRGYFGLDTAPTSEMALIYGSATSTGASGGIAYVTIGTDRKLRLYDKAGTLLLTSTSTIPTAGLQEVTIIIDCRTLATVWVSFIFGTTEDAFVDTGRTVTAMFTTGSEAIFWGEALAGGVNRGCHLYADDLTSRYTDSAGDAPHVAAYPRLNIYGAVNPTTNGNYTAWDSNTNDTIDSATTLVAYLDNGELPTHDGNTSTIASSTESENFTVKSTVANPLPDPWTVAWVAVCAVLRNTDVAKISPGVLLRLTGTDLAYGTGGGVSTTFVGIQQPAGTQPDLGAWVRADADASTLEWGFQAASIDAGARVTLMLGPLWIGSNASLSLTTTPISTYRRRGIVAG